MLKAGIIGLGHGSRVLIDAFRLNNIEVYGVTSKNYSKAKRISKEKNSCFNDSSTFDTKFYKR